MTAGELLQVLEDANPRANLIVYGIAVNGAERQGYEIINARTVSGQIRATVKNPSPPDIIELSCARSD
jgi:hypothetical protein